MFRTAIVFAVMLSCAAPPAQAQGRGGGGQGATARTPSIDERTNGLQKLDGFFPLYWDERSGSLLVEIPRFNADFLFATGLSAGLGSNDIGLDRGQEGGGRIVRFERIGPKVLMVQPNLNFRASGANPAERK